MNQKKEKETCTIVVFGATGNLTSLKLFPAIYELYENYSKDYRFRILGFARRDWSDENLREVARQTLSKKTKPLPRDFEENIHYIASNFDEDRGYNELKTLISQKDPTLYYFSVDPISCFTILRKMRDHSFADLDKNKRIILEKPFGTNLATAEKLDEELKSVFKEEELYNIDHYLGKEMVQNLYDWREKNKFLDKIWNKEQINSIEVILDEKVDVNERPGFYDQTGALSDMVQNHALQVLSLLAASVTEAKKKSLAVAKRKFIESLQLVNYTQDILRAQYAGYREHKLKGKEETLPANTQTETFVALRLESSSPEWETVSFFIKTGKALPQKRSIAIVNFKGKGNPIYLKFILDSNNTPLLTSFRKPEFLIHKTPFTFLEEGEKLPSKRILSDYASLLWDSLLHKKTHFVSLQEIRASWKLIDKIRSHFKEIPLLTYEIGSEPAFLGNFLPSLKNQD